MMTQGGGSIKDEAGGSTCPQAEGGAQGAEAEAPLPVVGALEQLGLPHPGHAACRVCAAGTCCCMHAGRRAGSAFFACRVCAVLCQTNWATQLHICEVRLLGAGTL